MLQMINLNIYLFISYLIVSVKLNCFSWKKQKIKRRLHWLLGAWKKHYGARAYLVFIGSLTSSTSRVLRVASLLRFNRRVFSSSGRLKCVCDKVFECTEHSADRNSSHWTRIRRVSSSNPGADKTDSGSFRSFPQSSDKCCFGFTLPRSI